MAEPEPLAGFVADAAAALACPPDYLGVPMLALAGAAVGASRELEIKAGWRERPCLYAAVVGPPGSAKSPALKLVAAPVYAEQARRVAHYRRQKIAHEEDGDGTAPAPALSTAYVSDITTEALARVLQDNPRGVALIRMGTSGGRLIPGWLAWRPRSILPRGGRASAPRSGSINHAHGSVSRLRAEARSQLGRPERPGSVHSVRQALPRLGRRRRGRRGRGRRLVGGATVRADRRGRK
jgi:hypothetical protein